MTARYVKILISVLAFLVSHGESFAQRNSIGTSWSLSGIGITYERDMVDDSFAQFSIQSELGETFTGRGTRPGVSAAFTWNIIFAQMESRNGVPVRFYAGPGFAAGISQDFMGPQGLFFGLKGRVGMQCLFARKINVSLSLAPILGIHISEVDEYILTRAYRNGLIQVIIPEIGISYRF